METRRKGKGKAEGGDGDPAARSRHSDTGPKGPPGSNPKARSGDAVRHTRHERIWLHVNYHGETPFLQAWGLDIAKLADRLEGLAILRDLIQAEAERRGLGSPKNSV